ncbi:hypothetical protein LJC35_03350 [Parabacteroides sp. OttesenSCG-928-N08]|nr:hypothetical protein [Parabacteroides sp. OttesenSCG-928-N08]
MSKQLVNILIPIYKQTPTAGEIISLQQCCRVLHNHPITLFVPSSLIIDEYQSIFNENKTPYTVERFPDPFFQGIEGYNQLLLSTDFYGRFTDYEYLLIYQLDAFVFTDELSYWCSKGYDYIGAPWFWKFWRFKPTKRLYAVGNGGFSLRRTEACMRILTHKGTFKSLTKMLFSRNNLFQMILKHSRKDWGNIKWENNVLFYTSINQKTEDYFWSFDAKESHVDFRVAPLKEAIGFSFECRPSLLFKKNNNKLPFGCHAWEKYEPLFWKQYINQ